MDEEDKLMKKTKILFLSLIALMLDSAINFASADESYVCTHGQKERVISVVYGDQATKLPCDVRYQKDGDTQTLWHAENEEGYCKQKAVEFVQKQEGWGWDCTEGAMDEDR